MQQVDLQHICKEKDQPKIKAGKEAEEVEEVLSQMRGVPRMLPTLLQRDLPSAGGGRDVLMHLGEESA